MTTQQQYKICKTSVGRQTLRLLMSINHNIPDVTVQRQLGTAPTPHFSDLWYNYKGGNRCKISYTCTISITIVIKEDILSNILVSHHASGHKTHSCDEFAPFSNVFEQLVNDFLWFFFGWLMDWIWCAFVKKALVVSPAYGFMRGEYMRELSLICVCGQAVKVLKVNTTIQMLVRYFPYGESVIGTRQTPSPSAVRSLW